MTTRASMEDFMNQAEKALEYANGQLRNWKQQEHYNEDEYNQAQYQLENMNNELDHLQLFSTPEQKERIRRMQLQIRQVQNDLVLNQNDLLQDRPY